MKSHYVVKNVSSHIITLTDLHAEIRPNKEVDLEKIARRIDIDRSIDLAHALRLKKLKVVRKSKLHSPPPMKPRFPNKEQLQNMIRNAVTSSQQTGSKEPFDAVRFQEAINRKVAESISKQFDGKFKTLLKAIQSISNKQPVVMTNFGTSSVADGPMVDIEQLAEIMQKGIDSITSEMDEGQSLSKTKKIKLNTAAVKMSENLD